MIYFLSAEAPRLFQAELWSLGWKPPVEYILEAVALREKVGLLLVCLPPLPPPRPRAAVSYWRTQAL